MNLQDKIQIVGVTDTGKVRKNNEDSIGYDVGLGLSVLADGMGGHLGGEIASSLSVNTILESLQQNLPSLNGNQANNNTGVSQASMFIQDAIEQANDLIYQKSRSDPALRGMGTTIVVLLLFDNRISLAHIGDSRCYRLRDNQFEQITKDHSLIQELIDRGFYTPEEARKSLNRNLVTKALGINPGIIPDLYEEFVMKNDIYLLCSDGLTDLVDDDYISLTIKRFSDNLDDAAKQLITKANQNGGNDNISVILCRVTEDLSTSKSWVQRITDWFKPE